MWGGQVCNTVKDEEGGYGKPAGKIPAWLGNRRGAVVAHHLSVLFLFFLVRPDPSSFAPPPRCDFITVGSFFLRRVLFLFIFRSIYIYFFFLRFCFFIAQLFLFLFFVRLPVFFGPAV